MTSISKSTGTTTTTTTGAHAIVNRYLRRFMPLLFCAAFVAILALSQFVSVDAVPTANGTIPPLPPGLMMELRGPITQDNPLEVAGVPIEKLPWVSINERFDQLVEGNWARVQGIPDGAGGIKAYRIKVMSAQDFARLRGTLDEPLPDPILDVVQASVGDVIFAVTPDTRIVGNPHKTPARVDVKLFLDENKHLGTAFQIVMKANPRDINHEVPENKKPDQEEDREKGNDKNKDDQNDEEAEDEESDEEGTEEETDRGESPVRPGDYVRFVATISSLSATDADPWNIGGLEVFVDSATYVNERKGPATEGTRVKVVAIEDEGALIAVEIVVLTPDRP